MATVMATVMVKTVDLAVTKTKQNSSQKKYRICIGFVNVLLLILVGFFSPYTWAGDWKLTDSIGISTSALQRDNKNSPDTTDLSLQIRPNISLNGQSGRTSANIRYGLTSSFRDSGNNATNLSHSLNGSARSEIYEDQIFLTATARAGLTTARSTSASVDSVTAANDGIQTYALTLGPSFRHHLSKYVDIVSDNTFGFSGSDSNNSSDSFTQLYNINLNSGRYFSRFNWSAGFVDSFRQIDTRTENTQSVNASGSYRLNRKIQLRAGLGYSSSDAPTSRSSNSSANWTFGGNWTPNSRTVLNAIFGLNHSGYNWNANFSHSTRRTRIESLFSRSLTNSAALGSELLEPGLNPDGTPVLDPRDGLPLLDPLILLVPTDENFINTVFSTAITITGRRTTVIGRVRLTQRDYDVSDITDNLSSLSLTATRQLSPRTSLSANAVISDLKSSNSNDDRTYDLSLGLTKSFGRKSSISALVSHRLNEVSNGSGYSENRLTLSVNSRFL